MRHNLFVVCMYWIRALCSCVGTDNCTNKKRWLIRNLSDAASKSGVGRPELTKILYNDYINLWLLLLNSIRENGTCLNIGLLPKLWQSQVGRAAVPLVHKYTFLFDIGCSWHLCAIRYTLVNTYLIPQSFWCIDGKISRTATSVLTVFVQPWFTTYVWCWFEQAKRTPHHFVLASRSILLSRQARLNHPQNADTRNTVWSSLSRMAASWLSVPNVNPGGISSCSPNEILTCCIFLKVRSKSADLGFLNISVIPLLISRVTHIAVARASRHFVHR